jgi:hypothetical protein
MSDLRIEPATLEDLPLLAELLADLSCAITCASLA